MVLGLIGGIGVGKSEVAKIFIEKYDAIHINADKIGHLFLKKDSVCYNELLSVFGNSVIEDTGDISRRKLGGIVFNNEKKLKELNGIIHPVMKEKIQKDIQNKLKNDPSKIILLEAAVLLTANWQDLTDKLLLVICNEEERMNRLVKSRGMNREIIKGVIDKQLEENKLKEYADFIVDNSFERHNTIVQIEKIVDGSLYETKK